MHPAVTWWWYSCVNEGEQFKCSNYSVEELDWLSCSDKETHPVLSQNFDLILASGKKCLLIICNRVTIDNISHTALVACGTHLSGSAHVGTCGVLH